MGAPGPAYRDFRKSSTDKDIDAVIIATQDQWHAQMLILACNAGKDVYLEKPVMYRLREAKAMIDAVRRNRRIVQIGTQHRAADHIAEAARIVQGGKIGEVRFVRVWNYMSRTGGAPVPDSEPPADLDWDAWLGPAPEVPFNRGRLDYRSWMDYTNGIISDYGNHRFDTVHQIMGAEIPLKVSSSSIRFDKHRAGDIYDFQQATYEYPNFIMSYEASIYNGHGLGGQHSGQRYYGMRGAGRPASRHGVLRHGSRAVRGSHRDGALPRAARRRRACDGREAPAAAAARPAPAAAPERMHVNEDEPTPLHTKYFVDYVRARKDPFANIEVGARATAISCIGNVAAWTGRKLTWDGATWQFKGDAEANGYLFREYRNPGTWCGSTRAEGERPMSADLSRRDFLTAGLAVPASGLLPTRSLLLPPGSQAKTAPVNLTFRTLGRTGLRVTSLAFGCMTTSDPSVIRRAADVGINHFDTARVYQNGNNERMVGAALKDVRKQVYISSKSQAQTGAQLLADLDTSLRELGTDYLDIYYLHMRNEPGLVTEDLLDALRTAKQAGKIRFAGVSTHFNMDKMLAHLATLGQVDIVLTSYNFAMRSVDAAMNQNPDAPSTDMTAAIRSARKAGLGVVAMKVMAGGVSRVGRGDRLYGANPAELSKRLSQPGVPVAAIKWALKNDSVDTAIVCMTDHDQLDENLRAMAEPYTDRDELLLSTQLAEHQLHILPDVRGLRGNVRKGRAGARRAPVPDLRGRLRPVRARPSTVPRDASAGPGHPMPRLQRMHLHVRQWGVGPQPPDTRPGDARRHLALV